MFFGCKPYSVNEEVNNHSLPSTSNTRMTERYAEVLSSISEEMLNSESPYSVHSNNRSSQSGT